MNPVNFSSPLRLARWNAVTDADFKSADDWSECDRCCGDELRLVDYTTHHICLLCCAELGLDEVVS